MKGYKAFNSDLTCRGFQYEIGGEYVMEGEIEPCRRGFHFCEMLKQTAWFYSFDPRTRWCEIEASDTVIPSDVFRKYVTNHIRILREIPWETVCEIIDVNDGNPFVLTHIPAKDIIRYSPLINRYELERIITKTWETVSDRVSRIVGKIACGADIEDVYVYFGVTENNELVSCPKDFALKFIREHTEGK